MPERAQAEKVILVVDDDPALVDLLQITLELAGYRVIGALDGRSALDKARTEDPMLMILDIAMPDMDGWEVLQRIESDPKTAGLPVIMLSAMDADADVMRGLQQGAVDYIAKPFEVGRFVSTVRLLLDKLDARGRDAYRQELIAYRRRFMHTLNNLFPHG